MFKLINVIIILLLMSSCSPGKSVVFVTKTSLSILEADSKPAGVSIAYDRIEGYLGPRYENGAVPPVYAAIETNGKIFNPSVNQLYATGRAAEIATTKKAKARETTGILSGKKQVMFFGTATTTGLKIGVTGSVPDSFVFGYRRKEFSYIPLGTVIIDNKEVDSYPSVLAAIQTRADVGENPLGGDVGLGNKQFFATGVPAEQLAEILRPVFLEKAKRAIGNPAKLAACYAQVSFIYRPNVWKDASKEKLFFEETDEEGNIFKDLQKAYNKAFAKPVEKDCNKASAKPDEEDCNKAFAKSIKEKMDIFARANSAYLHSMRFKDSLDDPGRSIRLSNHTNFVCALAKLNEPTGN